MIEWFLCTVAVSYLGTSGISTTETCVKMQDGPACRQEVAANLPGAYCKPVVTHRYWDHEVKEQGDAD